MIPVKNAQARRASLFVVSYERKINGSQYWISCVTLTLAVSNLALKGHKEEIGQPNIRNVLAIIDLLNKCDPLLQEIVSGPKSR